ncbi:MAG: hypothetical protein WC044_04455 [Crocinitomicaceae bacterium]
MKEIQIDSETAHHIVQTFQLLNALSKKLKEDPFAQWKQVVDGGDELNTCMNHAMQDTTLQNFQIHLTDMLQRSTTLKSITENFNPPTPEIDHLFSHLIENLQMLLSTYSSKK